MSRPIIPVQIPPFGCLKSSSNYAHPRPASAALRHRLLEHRRGLLRRAAVERLAVQDKYTGGGVDQIPQRIQDTAPEVAAVLQGIKARAPQSSTTS
jgi:hypothetical protein